MIRTCATSKCLEHSSTWCLSTTRVKQRKMSRPMLWSWWPASFWKVSCLTRTKFLWGDVVSSILRRLTRWAARSSRRTEARGGRSCSWPGPPRTPAGGQPIRDEYCDCAHVTNHSSPGGGAPSRYLGEPRHRNRRYTQPRPQIWKCST